jgi:DNA recombination protein RmuC
VDTYNQFLGTLETRVMVTSRKMAELGVVADEVETVPPVEVAVRSMTQADLLAEELESGTPGRDLLVEEEEPAQGSESRSA